MDILETEAKNMIRDYLNILACKFIDDESTYMKHLQKQAALNNEEAMHKLSVCKHFEHWHAAWRNAEYRTCRGCSCKQ